jgi:hypothetical protein
MILGCSWLGSPALAYAVIDDGLGGGRDCIVILKKKRETNDRRNALSFCHRNHLPVGTSSPAHLPNAEQVLK